jgi:hypothetical protein
VEDSVKVLMKPIQQKTEEFLRIMLLRPAELSGKVGDGFLWGQVLSQRIAN